MKYLTNNPENNISKNKKVFISTDDNPMYYFFSPITSLLWSEYMDYQPIIFIVASSRRWTKIKSKNLIIQKTLEAGADVVLLDADKIKTNPFFKGYNLSMLSQVSRFCSTCVVVNQDSYCLTSDIDMLPLNKDYFHQQDFNKEINLFYANGYEHKRYPICYIGMKASNWKTIMGIRNNDIHFTLSRLVSKLKRNSDNYTQWGFDEVLFYNNITSSKFYPQDCEMIDRKIYKNPGFIKGVHGLPMELPEGRLDRSNWVFNGDITSLVDAHCKRPGYIKENWLEIRDLLSYILSTKHMKWIDEYYLQFMEISCLDH